ncbi:hypothetical protein VQH23_00310 [Pararoseomonas sp. SCSIO 73927]|uniref:hypothetical protein n=1 Tax=Pararoseomonas sp. SCSIO 73927 TaxID=3114537 RepID=UPI0030CD77B3
MHTNFSTSDLIGLFRAGLVALVPVAERARIAWRSPAAYDPWESIERALFASIVSSVVENAIPNLPAPLPKYGLTYPSYDHLSFLTDRAARQRGETLVFLMLTTANDPFDTMCFVEVDGTFIPTGRKVEVPLSQALPEVATRTIDGLRYLDVIEYHE